MSGSSGAEMSLEGWRIGLNGTGKHRHGTGLKRSGAADGKRTERI